MPVVAGAEVFNPTIDLALVARARADPSAAVAEWHGEFRADLLQLLGDATIEAAVDYGRPLELPPRADIDSRAVVDAAARRHDASCIGIGPREEGRFVADVVSGRHPSIPLRSCMSLPRLPRSTAAAASIGDNYAGKWLAQLFVRPELPTNNYPYRRLVS